MQCFVVYNPNKSKEWVRVIVVPKFRASTIQKAVMNIRNVIKTEKQLKSFMIDNKYRHVKITNASQMKTLNEKEKVGTVFNMTYDTLTEYLSKFIKEDTYLVTWSNEQKKYLGSLIKRNYDFSEQKN